jgi:hypothetical protein
MENRITLKALSALAAFAFAAAVTSQPADAASKRKKGAKRAPIAMKQPAFRQEPARMIEIRPGYWISSYGCYTDEGYGRIGGCDGHEGAD